MTEQEKKYPVEGETVIATITGRYNGVEEKRTVYYGNIVMTEGKKGKFKVKNAQYEKLLAEFFASEEGKGYVNPSTKTEERKAEVAETADVQKDPKADEAKREDKPKKQEKTDKNKKEKDPVPETKENPPVSSQQDDKNEEQAEPETRQEELAVNTAAGPELPEYPEKAANELAVTENGLDEVVLTENSDPVEPAEKDEVVLINNDQERIQDKKQKKSPWTIIAAVAAILACIFSGITAFNSFDFNKQPETEPVKEYEIVKVAQNIPAGTVITDEMLTSEVVTEPDYLALFTDKQILKTDGSTIYEKPVLWSNKSQAVGTYAVDTINSGSYLLNSGYSSLKEGENLVEMNIDGTTVRVPVEAVANGSSTIRLYAIVTTSDKDGNKKTYPMDLGEFKLEGKTLTDIINAEGKSVLEQITKDTEAK